MIEILSTGKSISEESRNLIVSNYVDDLSKVLDRYMTKCNAFSNYLMAYTDLLNSVINHSEDENESKKDISESIRTIKNLTEMQKTNMDNLKLSSESYIERIKEVLAK